MTTLFQQISDLRSKGQLHSSQYDYYRKLCRNAIHRMKTNGPKKHILQTERSWAYAMELRSKASTLNEPRKYRHAMKAWKRAHKMVMMIEDPSTTTTTTTTSDILQLITYRSWIEANLRMEEKKFAAADALFSHCQSLLPLLEDCLFKESCLAELESFLRFCQYKRGNESSTTSSYELPSHLIPPTNYKDLLRDSSLSSECSSLSIQTNDRKVKSLLEAIPQLNSKSTFLNSNSKRLHNILVFLQKRHSQSPLLKIVEAIIRGDGGNEEILNSCFAELKKEYPSIQWKKKKKYDADAFETEGPLAAPEILLPMPKPIFFDIASDFINPIIN